MWGGCFHGKPRTVNAFPGEIQSRTSTPAGRRGETPPPQFGNARPVIFPTPDGKSTQQRFRPTHRGGCPPDKLLCAMPVAATTTPSSADRPGFVAASASAWGRAPMRAVFSFRTEPLPHRVFEMAPDDSGMGSARNSPFHAPVAPGCAWSYKQQCMTPGHIHGGTRRRADHRGRWVKCKNDETSAPARRLAVTP